MPNFGPQLKQQVGAVLITSLMMLVVMTILAISSINSSTVNLHIVNNMQSMREVEDAAQDGINQIISSPANFLTTPAATTLTINGQTVEIAERDCLQADRADGYSALAENSPDMTIWEVTAEVTDNTSNASITLHQGVKIQLPAGNCT